ncbi:hypothetical protein ES332_D06G083000v1 [Gossypium tomentosum]|uniref:Uncharacterized protein n=1 Tax=Gossypium tomentosum TaxID=34277 RepID=A0A5D2KG37_GOSTO|nr:hypothetical protein ES332_D06G083000v1 [Gossypium tomentosum]
MGEHQTRLKVLDDNIKAIADSQTTMRRDFDMLAYLVEYQRRLLQEVLAKLNGTSIADSPGASPSMDFVGFTPLGHHKPAPVQMARFAGDHPERWVMQAERYFDFYQIKLDDRIKERRKRIWIGGSRR